VHRLLIEDDPAIAAPLSRALIRDGYQVEVVGDGPTELQGALAGGYDLMVELVQARPAVFELSLVADRG
jgi:DNA-binding response OmpR family regulator